MDLSSTSDRKKLIKQIESNENKGRKSVSYKASEIFRDNIKPYVINELREQFSESTVKEMPISYSANIAKRVVNQVSTVYQEAPERTWSELSDDQKEVAWEIYHEMKANKKLMIANKYLRLHRQCLLWIVPKEGVLTMRVLQPHQWDVVTDPNNPERALAYIISSYDNYNQLQDVANAPGPATGISTISDQNARNYDQKLASDKAQDNKRYLFWTETENYMTDSGGNILGDVLPNPIAPAMPFIEVCDEKEFEYWVRTQSPYTNFTIQFNARKSEVAQIVKMQGFAQAILKGPKEMLMNSIQLGPQYVLQLVSDPTLGIDTTFEYAQPGSDINGALRFLEAEISLFLTSEGVDPKSVTMSGEGQNYTSGLERLLSLIEKMSASRSDYDLFQYIETKLWDMIKLWSAALSNSDNLREDLRLGVVNQNSEVNVTYKKPEMVLSDADKLDIAERRINLGISSAIEEIMRERDIERDEAEEVYQQLRRDEGLIEANIEPDRDLPRD
jgi:hypothetical protein